MALTPEQIKKLLAMPDKRGGRKPKGHVDTSVRDYQTWFKLATKMVDEEDPDKRVTCSNPDCLDRRENRTQLCAKIDDQWVCRICFLDSYLLSTLTDDNGS